MKHFLYKLLISCFAFLLISCNNKKDAESTVKLNKDGIPILQPFEDEMPQLTTNYVKLIKNFSNGILYKIKPVISCIYPIPQNINNEMVGSTEDRIKYTLYINEKLKTYII